MTVYDRVYNGGGCDTGTHGHCCGAHTRDVVCMVDDDGDVGVASCGMDG